MNLPVFTASGRHLGRVSSFDLELEAGAIMITHFYVRTGLIKGLWHEQLVIHKNQVVSIDREKMIVEDAATKETVADLKDISLVAPATE